MASLLAASAGMKAARSPGELPSDWVLPLFVPPLLVLGRGALPLHTKRPVRLVSMVHSSILGFIGRRANHQKF